MRCTAVPVRLLRVFRLGLHLVWGLAFVGCFYPWIHDARRLRFKQRWARQFLTILAVRLDARLDPHVPGSLYVANHISWLDIMALNAACPVAFVSKAEVHAWPLIGWLAAKADTVFLRRGSRGHAKLINREIGALLEQGKDVAIFPEGTTTDGTHLLHFHAALLQPAVEGDRPVQPVALSYRDAQGARSLAPSYAGETSLLSSLRAVLACRKLTVSVCALPLLVPQGRSRRELSDAAHRAIEISLGFLPPSKAPETAPDLQA